MEYKNIEGLILLFELPRRRIRSINKVDKIGQNWTNRDKGYIHMYIEFSPEDVEVYGALSKYKEIDLLLYQIWLITLCDSQNRDGMKPTGNVISVKNKLCVARRFAGSRLGIEIYRFEVSNYHIGEIVTFGGLFFT